VVWKQWRILSSGAPLFSIGNDTSSSPSRQLDVFQTVEAASTSPSSGYASSNLSSSGAAETVFQSPSSSPILLPEKNPSYSSWDHAFPSARAHMELLEILRVFSLNPYLMKPTTRYRRMRAVSTTSSGDDARHRPPPRKNSTEPRG